MHSLVAKLVRRLSAVRASVARPLTLGASLVILSLSVLLFVDLFGLRNDTRDELASARKTVAETFAMQLSTLASIGDLAGTRYAVASFVERNADVDAAALMLADGGLWASHGSPELLADIEGGSTLDRLHVPIYAKDLPWGDVRIAFAPSDELQRDLLWLAAVACGLFASFAIFLWRVLVQLDPGRAVPGRVESAMNLFTAGVVVLDGRGQIVMTNRAAVTLSGQSAAALTGRRLDDWSWQTDAGWQAPWTTVQHSGLVASDELMRLRMPDGESRLLSVSCASVGEQSSKLQGVLVTLDDLSAVERKNHELADALAALGRTQEEIALKNRELELLATTDPLTGIANRRTLMERLAQAIAVAKQEGTALACIMTDIDHFKQVNDTHGHATGDEVIKAVSGVLMQIGRERDTIGRYGGEEFVMILPGLGADEAWELAERARIAVMALAYGDALEVSALSSSFGIADLDCGASDGAELVDAADQALYVAKEGGRNRVVLCSDAQTSSQVPEPGATSAKMLPGSKAREDDFRARIAELETTLRNRDRELSALREFDSLTGMPTGTLFLQRTQTELGRAMRVGHSVGTLSIELRELGRIVSGLGQGTAKALVAAFVHRLQSGLRSADLVTTIVGEHFLSRITVNEFAVLLTDLSEPADALIVVGRLKRLLLQPFEIGDQRLHIGVNIGISLADGGGDDAAGLVEQAREARKRAAGKPDKVSYSFASTELDQQARDYLQIDADLHEALDHGALEVWFQPKLDLATRRITGLEALLRWPHEIRGFISPAVFVAVAESNGLIERLSSLVLERTLDQIIVWREMGFDDLCVSMNLSPMQLRTESFVNDALKALASKKLPGGVLEIELTETSVLDRPDEAQIMLESLRSAGVKISIDDFGTGYTSLALLADLPLDTLKIDRSFISRMAESDGNRAIVKTIVAMAHALRLRVVGEGVETNDELQTLTRFGCDEVQGYLISRPQSADDVTTFLVRQRTSGDERAA